MDTNAKKISPAQITIPVLTALGLSCECTLLPLACLPEKIRTYKNLKETSLGLELQEFPLLPHTVLQELIKTLVLFLSELHQNETGAVYVWISGTHMSYPYIDPFEENQTQEESVSVLELLFLDMAKTMEISISEFSTLEPYYLLEEDIGYCLFLGT